jgi:hypothetical protein
MVAMSSFVTAASVITAGVTFTVVVMRTHESLTRSQVPRQIRLDNIFNRAFGSANDLDAVLRQCIDRAAANASADQHVNLFAGKQSGKCTMSGISARNNGGRDNLSVLAVVHGKLRRMSKVLEYISVFTGHGNFHKVLLGLGVVWMFMNEMR